MPQGYHAGGSAGGVRPWEALGSRPRNQLNKAEPGGDRAVQEAVRVMGVEFRQHRGGVEPGAFIAVQLGSARHGDYAFSKGCAMHQVGGVQGATRRKGKSEDFMSTAADPSEVVPPDVSPGRLGQAIRTHLT